jgi:hypothetical protein
MAVKTVRLLDEDIAYLQSLLQKDFTKVSSSIKKKLARALNPIQVSSAKQKGMALQRKVAEDLAGLIGAEASLADDAEVSWRPSGQHGVDIIFRGEAKSKLPLAIECKAVRSFRFKEALEQADANADGGFPLVVYRPTGESPVVILRWEVFKKMTSDFVLRTTVDSEGA